MPTLSRLLVPAAALSLAALAAAVSLQKIRTFDYWWHLRTGKLIVDAGAVPVADPYTYTAPGAPWLDSHWLHQVGLYGVYSIGDHEGAVVAKFAVVLLLVGMIGSIGYRRERPEIGAAVLALMLLAVYERLMPRPELASFAALAAVLALLERFRRTGGAAVYAIVPIQLLWTNAHGLWVLGLVVCAAHLAEEGLRALRGSGGSARLRRLGAVMALSLLVAFANPYGVNGALYPLHFLDMLQPGGGRDVLGALIRELDPVIGGRHPLGSLPLFCFGALVAVSFAAMLANRRRLALADPLVWLAFLGLALSANRNIALFAIVAAPIAVRNLNEFLDGTRLTVPRAPRAAIAAAVPLLIFAAAADIFRGGPLAEIRESAAPGLGILERVYPVKAVDWIEREQPPGPIAHHQADGGYLIWRLFPKYLVMLDGRLEVFGGEKLLDLAYTGPTGLARLDQRYGFGTVLVHHARIPSDALLWGLYRDRRWQLAHVDDVAAVFVRRRPGVAALDVDLDSPALFPPSAGRRSRDDYERRLARANFLYAMHRYERALSLWLETAGLYPDGRDVGYALARFSYATGAIAAGDAVLDRLLGERPNDARLKSRAADLRLAAGRRGEAAALYDAALALDPDLEPALIARARLAEEDGDIDTARLLYRRLLRLVPRADPERAAVRRKLFGLRK